MGTPFMIDAETAEAIKQLRRDAEANPIDREAMLALVAAHEAGRATPPMLNRVQTTELPFGYTLTFTVEWQPIGMARHMSIASPRIDRAPIPMACEMVMEHLGYTGGFEACETWMERLANGGVAVNVVEIMTPALMH